MDYSSTFVVSNIHCPSCTSYIQDILRPITGIEDIHVSLIDHLIRIKHHYDQVSDVILAELTKAAFEVRHVTTIRQDDSVLRDFDVPQVQSFPALRSWRMSKAQRKHIDNCEACQQEKNRWPRHKSFQDKWTRVQQLRSEREEEKSGIVSNETLVEDGSAVIDIDGSIGKHIPAQYTATISIGGMTCASCVGTISQGLDKLDFVTKTHVNLVANNASVAYHGPESNVSKIVDEIEDLGYEATLVSTESTTEPQLLGDNEEQKVVLSIEGMSCGSCVGTITRGLQELSFIRTVNVDLVGNRGVVTFDREENLASLLEKIEDLGYEATVVQLAVAKEADASRPRERTVQLRIDGIHCEHCPTNITTAVQSSIPLSHTRQYSIVELPKLKNPVMTIQYRPTTNLTIRDFVQAINRSDEALTASVYHSPSLEERSRRLQRNEMRRIAWRLLFSGIVAIPTFIIGVVYMSLVPRSNLTRQWWEQPVLAGQVMRLEWALFFMTTPVMLFGTDLFHVRAYKEIKAMWRRNSKIPILRRFYRFGSMNLLISAGACVAYFSSLAVLILDATEKPMPARGRHSSDTYFDTVTFLTFFILIGRFLEAYSKTKTGDAVAMLSKLRPSKAMLCGSNGPFPVAVDQLEVGDVVQIPHGTSPPTDGIITQEGPFLFDESSLTGESKPVKKNRGDEVYTGSVNVSDPVRIKVTSIGGTSMLDRIVNVVREGQAKRAPIERIADILTGYFVPVITLTAIITWTIWLSLGLSGALPRAWLDVERGGWPFWSLEFAIAVFVVACPCGIGLAAPTALFVGGGLAAKQGILVQGGGEAFQEASKLDAIVFDKTGTLTEGQMRVTNFEVIRSDQPGLMPFDKDVILASSRLLEESSTHPIAKAIASYCAAEAGSASVRAATIREAPGAGMGGVIDVGEGIEHRYELVLGNEKLLQATKGLPAESDEKAASSVSIANDCFARLLLQQYQGSGRSTAIFAARKVPYNDEATTKFTILAVFAITDPIRPEAVTVLDALRNAGLSVHMCTGDNATTALAIASQLNIPATNIRAGVLPQDKAAYIRELQGLIPSPPASRTPTRKIIAFVGDGTNDTPALSAADVSMALSSGSDVAITTASFVLLNSDLRTILTLVRLARRVFRRVKMNFAWAAVYNLCLVPVAAGVFFAVGAGKGHGGWRLSPVWASVAMAMSSVSVVLSSLALRLPGVRVEGLLRRKREA
jgi:P-type Cu+ transporter